ncbi:MAG: methyltransferase domain-containing protein [Gemmatimonadaceae bacterium]
MPAALTPTRRRGVEKLEVPGVPGAVVRRSLADVARANALFGGTRAVLSELRPLLAARARSSGDRTLTLLDVGTGIGDIALAAQREAVRRGVGLATIGADSSIPLLGSASQRLDMTLAANALELPFADWSVDIVVCSQLLHHFTEREIASVLRELHRVARVRVIISDLRRSWMAAAGIWLASFPLHFHPISRHDGVLSVLRGFTAPELGAHIVRATGVSPTVTRRLGWRVTASWTPLA